MVFLHIIKHKLYSAGFSMDIIGIIAIVFGSFMICTVLTKHPSLIFIVLLCYWIQFLIKFLKFCNRLFD